MADSTPQASHDEGHAYQQGTAVDPERRRQAEQAESSAGIQHGGEYEPSDSRNVTGAGGAGVGSPGGADQQEGGSRWGGDGQQDQSAEARQPTGESAAAQSLGVLGEQEGQQDQASPQLSGGAGTQQDLGVPQHSQASQQQTLAGMSQSQGGDPSRQGFVDQQSASLGNRPQDQQPLGQAERQSVQQQQQQSQQPGGSGSDDQVESMLGVGSDDLGSGSAGQQQQQSGAGGEIREHMEVIGADGVHLGTVDKVEGDRIKLTKRDSDAGFEGGQHHGHHHYISLGLVAAVEGEQVRLSATAANAYALEEEQ